MPGGVHQPTLHEGTAGTAIRTPCPSELRSIQLDTDTRGAGPSASRRAVARSSGGAYEHAVARAHSPGSRRLLVRFELAPQLVEQRRGRLDAFQPQCCLEIGEDR